MKKAWIVFVLILISCSSWGGFKNAPEYIDTSTIYDKRAIVDIPADQLCQILFDSAAAKGNTYTSYQVELINQTGVAKWFLYSYTDDKHLLTSPDSKGVLILDTPSFSNKFLFGVTITASGSTGSTAGADNPETVYLHFYKDVSFTVKPSQAVTVGQ